MKKLVVLLALVLVSLCARAYAEDAIDGIPAEVHCRTLTIREEPSERGDAIYTLNNGEQVILFTNDAGNYYEEEGFVHVYHEQSGTQGWCRKHFLTMWPRHLVTAENTMLYASEGMSMMLTEELELGRDYFMVELGNEMLLLEEQAACYVVEYNSAAFFIRKDANVFVKETAEYYSAGGTLRMATANANAVAYSLPDTSSYKVKVYSGDKVRIVAKHSRDWYIVMIGDRHAYIAREDVSLKR